MSTSEQVREVVWEAIDEANEDLDPGEQIDRDGILYGRGGVLDSLGLVNLLLAIEERLSDRFGIRVTLASDKAMSRERSPFRTTKALASFVEELLEVHANV
ncbi:MAG: hypothetical protein HYV60_06165 [Planctomycetia bacterium]|nr:hypothetical protein [Planctomycetia bacterium]